MQQALHLHGIFFQGRRRCHARLLGDRWHHHVEALDQAADRPHPRVREDQESLCCPRLPRPGRRGRGDSRTTRGGGRGPPIAVAALRGVAPREGQDEGVERLRHKGLPQERRKEPCRQHADAGAGALLVEFLHDLPECGEIQAPEVLNPGELVRRRVQSALQDAQLLLGQWRRRLYDGLDLAHVVGQRANLQSHEGVDLVELVLQEAVEARVWRAPHADAGGWAERILHHLQVALVLHPGLVTCHHVNRLLEDVVGNAMV
mmetsp:Transcript_102866/g.297418  ORF Transcript_102866/g.297418 Transcript_102866/m.297418 type:complete len:260 (-) Transcript_102866:123-902(-)